MRGAKRRDAARGLSRILGAQGARKQERHATTRGIRRRGIALNLTDSQRIQMSALDNGMQRVPIEVLRGEQAGSVHKWTDGYARRNQNHA